MKDEIKLAQKEIRLPAGHFCGGNCSDCACYRPYEQDSTGRGYCTYYNTHYYPTERNGCFHYIRG